MARDLEVNEEYFRRNYHRRRKVKRTNRIPQLIAGGLAAVTIFGAGTLLKGKPVEEAPTVSYVDTISDERVAPAVTIDEINALNIIINDGDCNDTFIENICQELEADGIKFNFTRDAENVNVDNSVVITLDQQYISGNNMAILGQYENGKNNDSDALAIAMNGSFSSSNDGIYAGRRCFKPDSWGGVTTRVPTSTEDAIDKDNVSFVTLCFGTNHSDPALIANSIVEGLGRFAAFRNEMKITPSLADEDLIYRASTGDSEWGLAEKFNCNVSDIKTKSDMLQADDAIENPAVKKINSLTGSANIIDSSKNKSDNVHATLNN